MSVSASEKADKKSFASTGSSFSGDFKPASFRICVRCLCFRRQRMLLIKHISSETDREFWTLPGGLVEKGETLAGAACRELAEETHLYGIPIGVVAINEFSEKSLLEIIFAFSKLKGRAILGFDPEDAQNSVKRIQKLKWFSREELYNLCKIEPSPFLEKCFEFQSSRFRIALPFNMHGD